MVVKIIVCGLCNREPQTYPNPFKAGDSPFGEGEMIKHMKKVHNVEVGAPR